MKLFEQILGHVRYEGECWEWVGAYRSGTPVIKRDGKTIAVRRAILLDKGVDVGTRLATYTCGNSSCVNPAHLVAITRKALQQRTAKTNDYAGRLTRCKRISAAVRGKHGKLTQEIVDEIRAAEGSQREIARRFGLHQSTVSAILSRKIWKDYSNPFAGLGAL